MSSRPSCWPLLGRAQRWATWVGATTLLALAGLVACGDEPAVDASGARELLARVQADSYRSWSRAPGWASRAPSLGGGHGGQLDIYVNARLASSLQSEQPVVVVPEGAIIVKDVWRGAELHALAIMEKRVDGWYWAEFDGAGQVSAGGHPDGCIACHRRGADFVRAFDLRSPPD